MQHKTLINALRKAGAKVTQPHDNQSFYKATLGKNDVYWYTQEGFPVKEKTVAICVHTASDQTDVQRDIFCDVFHHTIKETLRALHY